MQENTKAEQKEAVVLHKTK